MEYLRAGLSLISTISNMLSRAWVWSKVYLIHKTWSSYRYLTFCYSFFYLMYWSPWIPLQHPISSNLMDSRWLESCPITGKLKSIKQSDGKDLWCWNTFSSQCSPCLRFSQAMYLCFNFPSEEFMFDRPTGSHWSIGQFQAWSPRSAISVLARFATNANARLCLGALEFIIDSGSHTGVSKVFQLSVMCLPN